MVRLSVILLVDPQGRVLLQERDEHAPLSPNLWGMAGGHVEDGEDFEPAAYRELAEETGLRLPTGSLRLWREQEFGYTDAEHPFHYRVYAGATTATDADIVLGEGRQIVFVEPERIATLDRAESCVHFVDGFLVSDLYRALRTEAEKMMNP